MTCGWHKPRLRGRISTQACLVRRFTLSDKSSTGTQACPAASRYGTSASCITYADQRECVIVYVFSFAVMLIALQRWFGLHWISE